MRITVVSSGDVTRDPAAPPLLHSLRSAGHDVTLVGATPGVVDGEPITAPTEAATRRMRRSRDSDQSTLIGKTVNKTKPDLIHPIRQRDLPAALASKRGYIVRTPGWDVPPERDLIEHAPHRPQLSRAPVAAGLDLYHPSEKRPATTPQPDRHRGRRLALVYRHSGVSPARYLASAAERAGMDVQRFDARLDWGDVPPDTDAVVFVESPYPPAAVTGDNPGIPVLFWVHHGEHHLPANLRLTDRYQADAVLLAHSWHLTHRFPVAVHRFPFAVAPELYGEEPPPFANRTVNVAMVGAGVERESANYRERFIRIQDLRSEFPGSAVFRSDLDPEAMAAVYSNTRVVINDGGARHYPITMRVFEAIGAGAFLATEYAPGLDLLFKRRAHYDELSWTVPAHVRALVNDPRTGERAAAAHRHAATHHTYDHRLDDLLRIAGHTTHESRESFRPTTPLDRIVADDVEVTTIAVFGDTAPTLPDREVRNGIPWLEANRDGRFDAAVMTPGAAETALVAPAIRRYIYVVGGSLQRELDEVRRARPHATATKHEGIVRLDMGAPGYLVRDAP